MSTTFCHCARVMSSGLRGPGDAGVVDQDVDPAVGRDRLVHDRLDVGRLRDVAERAFDREPLRAHLCDRRRQPLLAARAQHERGAGFSQPLSHLLSEAARSAGDDRNAPVQSEQFVMVGTLSGLYFRPAEPSTWRRAIGRASAPPDASRSMNQPVGGRACQASRARSHEHIDMAQTQAQAFAQADSFSPRRRRSTRSSSARI